ncbi:hypothetical protein [Candidatus Vondammii sp. HM_W22]|uniref:hypothetical protein n=1 Tax=Candidatus Vondammii sp. HM_W22 TaxID=2687299 RepID=UPI002F37EE23
MKRYDRQHTLFYSDPPYWKTEGCGVEWGFGNYELMAKLARDIDGMLMISANDIPEMREALTDFIRCVAEVSATKSGLPMQSTSTLEC